MLFSSKMSFCPVLLYNFSVLSQCLVCFCYYYWLGNGIVFCYFKSVKIVTAVFFFHPIRKLYPELCQGIVDVAISSVFTLNTGGDVSSASSSYFSSSPSSTFTTNSCSSPKLRAPLHVGPFTKL